MRHGATENCIIGISACTCAERTISSSYLRGKLEENRSKYGTDGFKFDGGDVAYMQAEPYLYHDPEGDPNRYMQRFPRRYATASGFVRS